MIRPPSVSTPNVTPGTATRNRSHASVIAAGDSGV